MVFLVSLESSRRGGVHGLNSMFQMVFLVSLESSRRGGVHGLGSMLQMVFLVSLESSRRAWAWFHNSWTCGAKSLEY
jgi:hypothetical protein